MLTAIQGPNFVMQEDVQFKGKAAKYPKALVFTFPIEIYKYISRNQTFSFEVTGNYSWDLIPKSKGATFYDKLKSRTEIRFYTPKGPRFGSTKCEFITQSNGVISCKLTEKPKEYIQEYRHPSAKEKRPKSPRSYDNSEMSPEQRELAIEGLRIISKLQGETAYRLEKTSDGSFIWRVPRPADVELDEFSSTNGR